MRGNAGHKKRAFWAGGIAAICALAAPMAARVWLAKAAPFIHVTNAHRHHPARLVEIEPTGAKRYALEVEARDANPAGRRTPCR